MGLRHHSADQANRRFSSQNFLHWLENVESAVSVVLSIALLLVIFVSIADLLKFLVYDLIQSEIGNFTNNLFKIFGLFLNVLIALELLENITAYLKKHVIQVELVIVTSLIAVSRKFIILDLEKTGALELAALGVACLALGITYWLIHSVNQKRGLRKTTRKKPKAQLEHPAGDELE